MTQVILSVIFVGVWYSTYLFGHRQGYRQGYKEGIAYGMKKMEELHSHHMSVLRNINSNLELR